MPDGRDGYAGIVPLRGIPIGCMPQPLTGPVRAIAQCSNSLIAEHLDRSSGVSVAVSCINWDLLSGDDRDDRVSLLQSYPGAKQ